MSGFSVEAAPPRAFARGLSPQGCRHRALTTGSWPQGARYRSSVPIGWDANRREWSSQWALVVLGTASALIGGWPLVDAAGTFCSILCSRAGTSLLLPGSSPFLLRRIAGVLPRLASSGLPLLRDVCRNASSRPHRVGLLLSPQHSTAFLVAWRRAFSQRGRTDRSRFLPRRQR